MRLVKLPRLALTALTLSGVTLGATSARAQAPAAGSTAPAAPATTAPVVPAEPAPVLVPPPGALPDLPPTPAPAPPPAADGTVNVAPTEPVPLTPPPKAAEVPDYNAAATTNSNIQQVPVEPLPPLTPPGYSTARPYVASKIGGALMVGGGYEDFTNSDINQMTSGGGSWNARVVAGTRQFVGLEAAYVGAARNIDALGLSPDATLISNGVEGNVRVNIPIVRSVSMIEPFGFVGLGWSHYHVGNTATRTSDLATNDDVMTVPLGAGLEYAYKAFIADARFTYRPTYYNDLVRTGGGSLTNWGVGGQVGFSY
jgi:hypothetical protein